VGIMRIGIFVGSRANYGRLKSVILEFKKHQDMEVFILGACTLNQVKHDLEVDMYIQADMYSTTEANRAITIGLVTMQSANWLTSKKIDVAICHGDRFETIGFALAAKMANVKLAHLEAGEISNVDNNNRWIISTFADIHLCPTINSVERMADSKFMKYNPIFVGSPVVDFIRSKRLTGQKEDLIVIMYNPVDFGEFLVFTKEIKKLLRTYKDFKFIWINPNIDPGNKEILGILKNEIIGKFDNLEFQKNLSPDKFISLLNKSIALVGNTSAGIKEAYVLGLKYFLYGYRQGNREIFENTEHAYKDLATKLSIFLNAYKRNGLDPIEYRGELGMGDTARNIVSLIREEYK
jgi:UDP-hydrolysing UDP-N-acetyl-D-glucosamine 2-epimerase